MRRILAGAAALLVPMLLVAGPAVAAQKKNKDLDKNTEQTIKAGVLVGKVAAVYEDRRKIRLQVSVPVTRLNAGALGGIAQAQMQYRLAMARRDIQGMRSAQLQMMQQQAQLYQTEVVSQDVELDVSDDVVVRTARPKPDFDDKGRIKKLTKKDLKELKGPDPKLPGYKAEFGDVATEQVLRVQLVRKKDAPRARPVVRKKKKKNDEGDLGAEMDLLADNQPKVSMIVILFDPPPSR